MMGSYHMELVDSSSRRDFVEAVNRRETCSGLIGASNAASILYPTDLYSKDDFSIVNDPALGDIIYQPRRLVTSESWERMNRFNRS